MSKRHSSEGCRTDDKRSKCNDDTSPASKTVKAKYGNSGIQMKLQAPKKEELKVKVPVASIFQQDSDDEPEEMPKEAKMRMRNIGRDTPTSSGPNSFGKTKQGFCHTKKVFEKELEEAMNKISE